MTRTDKRTKPNRPQLLAKMPNSRRPNVEAMLREIAFVLHCTRKVKAEILADREEREACKFPPAAAMC